MNYQAFFRGDARTVAKALLGRVLVRESGRIKVSGKIVGTGAFEDDEGLAYRAGMLYAPGTIYVMPFRGSHFLNIATGRKGEASCVLIRQVQSDEQLIDGPGKVGRYFKVEDLDGELIGHNGLSIQGAPALPSHVKRIDGSSENCLGYYFIR